MKIKIYNLAIILVCLLFLGACSSEFLEVTPQQNVAVEDAITSLATLEVAVNGVYNNLQDDDYYGRTLPLIPELMADNVFISNQNANRYLTYDAFIVRSTSSYASEAWEDIFEVVVNTNRIIADGTKLTFPTDDQTGKANQLIGEVYTLRALAYFDLLRLFAQPYNFTTDASHPGVPVVDDSETGLKEPGRESVATIYTQVITDLEKAISLMTESSRDGFMSITAAKAILARAYLYQENWEKAAQYAGEVINSGAYTLLTNDAYTKDWNTSFNSESIFEVINTDVDNGGTASLGYFFSQDGYGDGLATQELYDLYSDSDVRKGFILPGARTGGEEEAYIIDKYNYETNNFKVIRLSEMYLIRAEAYAEQGNDAGAQADLNTIVQRADASAEAITLSGQELMNRIIEERRKELAFEGHRLFDLNRKKMDVNIIQTSDVITTTYPNDRYILPIPQSEIDANPGISAQQNPDY